MLGILLLTRRKSRFIYFGRVKFDKNTKTNFQAEYGDTEDNGEYPWYTLDHLYQAYLSKGMKHSKYLDKLRSLGFKKLAMNHRDRDSFLKYIADSNIVCSNVKRRTRRQLNPDQYLDHLVPTSTQKRVRSLSPDKFSLESLQKEEEQMLKARMQLEMLKDETRQQKAILDTVDSRRKNQDLTSRFIQVKWLNLALLFLSLFLFHLNHLQILGHPDHRHT